MASTASFGAIRWLDPLSRSVGPKKRSTIDSSLDSGPALVALCPLPDSGRKARADLGGAESAEMARPEAGEVRFLP
jgi:hypothetical protein